MTIRCGNREFHAHRAVVCTQSPFFDKALSLSFKEASSQLVDLPEDEPDTLHRFLEFLYTGTYSEEVNSTTGGPSTVALMDLNKVQDHLATPPGVGWDGPPRESTQAHTEVSFGSEGSQEEPEEEYNEFGDENPLVEDNEELNIPSHTPNDFFIPLRLYIMADKYDVPPLRLLARDRFYRAAERYWEECDVFPDIVDELYCCTPPTDTAMREIVCRLVGNRIRNSGIREKMRPIMFKHGEFAFGVMEYMMYHEGLEWE